ncbi:SDR family oxidoreductase [Nonomuraea endophytica]|uniref:SDR family oxidoreductase n=1 Tax=Nonomuraea endophytica TaxID=714136 RepID=UPI0037C58B0D
MTRILVTGAGGRLGGAVLGRLGGEAELRAVSRSARTGGKVEWVVADLTTGQGIAAAVDGVDVILHLASAPYKGRYTRRVELDGTAALLAAARQAGIGHIVYISIVGVDRVPWGYFRTKLAAEKLVRTGGVPWTILRVTQFYEFLDQALTGMSRIGLLVAEPGSGIQPVDVRDVAGELAARVAAGPAQTVLEYGGPEVIDFAEAVRAWRRARKQRPILRMRLPGGFGRAVRAGDLTTAARPSGTITWSEYLSG